MQEPPPRWRHYNHLLLNHAQSVEVVLISPRNPLNIGAVARAMANFGFEHLNVVAPYAPHWREARSAVGAPDLLQSTRECANLAEAVAACSLVIGTGTLTYRKPEQQVVRLPDLAPIVQQEIVRGGRVAIVFGPEKHGLTREDLSWCHLLVEIPTDARQPSMNLGQAVAVCLYEIGARAPSAEANSTQVLTTLSEGAHQLAASVATSGSLGLLADVIEETILASGYSPRSMEAANRHYLRLLLRRLAPNTRDTRRILGLFRRILWRLHQEQNGK
jgi:TrmH family RNA methyltransferase